MAIPPSSSATNDAVAPENESSKADDNAVVQLNRVRVVGGRTAGLKTGTTCHQCRQKTLNFAASCTNGKKKGVCSIKLCRKCLLNRYGEDAEDVENRGDWICPKCRGICNCSVCMKKKGHKPTGLLAFTAKAEGYKSVSEMLSVIGLGNLDLVKDDEIVDASDKEPVLGSPRKRGKENSLDLDLNATLDFDEQETKKAKPELLNDICNDRKDDGAAVNNIDAKAKIKATVKAIIKARSRVKEVDLDLLLPQGTRLTTVAGIDLDPEDVGNALQFLKFCETFGEVVDFNKSQAVTVLRELSRRGSGRSGRPVQYSSVVRFHTHFLSFLQEDIGEESPSTSNKNSWFQELEKCISDSGISDRVLKELPPGCFSRSSEGYDMLNVSQKLRLITFLCDEALGTAKLRRWIDEQIEISAAREKEAKIKFAAAKDKEKLLKKKLQDEKGKRTNADNGDSVSLSKHESIVSQLESEATQVEAEVVEATAMLPQKRQRSEVLRTEPYLLDVNGHAFWKLKGYIDEDAFMLQEMGTRDAAPYEEKWFVYGAEMNKPLEKYFSFLRLRKKRARSKKLSQTPVENSNEENRELSPVAN